MKSHCDFCTNFYYFTSYKFYSVFFESAYFFAAIDRKNRLPNKNVIIHNGINRRSVSNIFNCSQNSVNNAKMAPNDK